MTDRHKEHRASIIQRMSVDQHKRYEKGVEKYGTYLPDMSLPELLENALEETYDNTTYTITAIQKLKDLTLWSIEDLIEFRNRINSELEVRSQKELKTTNQSEDR